ncbi:lipopolysaccharide core heptose(II) kinase RfaY [Fusobacterium sp.]|uniref:lipopolysaccharide core heptose(II) kinase RfaY n=1 Tax=Fusobacterium sp. TaxID=68766 RepID=UPI002900E22D|nr:lipopolysaccharide core heptose(II) kinase RfaY [Fusobacterium sp.]MDU1912148.1 lipopolysaccharide core heptose(II) kinase RfaY [Fusobacterium sp.]
MIKNKKYKEYNIYYPEEEIFYEELGKRIIDKEFKESEVYKNTERNYVAKIEIKGEKYILKSPKSETIIPQRRIQTFIKNGEALNTLINVRERIKEGMKEYAVPFLVIVKKNIFIKESYILMECIEGESIKSTADIDKIMEIVNKLHKEKIYHGDLNTSNFIKTKNGVRIIDTQGKQERFFHFKRWNDIFIMENDLLVIEKEYEVEEKYYKKNKDISYYMILVVRKIKKLKFVEWIKSKKKELRKKGWRI